MRKPLCLNCGLAEWGKKEKHIFPEHLMSPGGMYRLECSNFFFFFCLSIFSKYYHSNGGPRVVSTHCGGVFHAAHQCGVRRQR